MADSTKYVTPIVGSLWASLKNPALVVRVTEIQRGSVTNRRFVQYERHADPAAGRWSDAVHLFFRRFTPCKASP